MPLDGACLGLALCPDVIRVNDCENGAAFRAKLWRGGAGVSRPYSKRLQTQLEICARPHQSPRGTSPKHCGIEKAGRLDLFCKAPFVCAVLPEDVSEWLGACLRMRYGV